MPGQAKINEVDPSIGDDVSKLLYKAAQQSWDNRYGAVVELHPSFSGLRALRPGYKPTDCYESMGSDGIGTKVEIAERLRDHSTIAFDLFAMACDDAVVRGAEPIGINTVLDVNRLDLQSTLTTQAIRELAIGYVAAAKAAGVVILNGETAELSDRVNGYGQFNYNWCATVLWYAQQDRLLTGHKIQPGNTLIGLTERGLRSNGVSDVRQAMLEQYGPNWHNETVQELGELSLGRLVQRPSTIYTRFITECTGGFDINKDPKATINGVAHITGGGQPEKMRRMLEPSGYGVIIDDPIPPPKIMTHVQQLRGFSDKKAYGKWHMGPGMVIATSTPEKVLHTLYEFNRDTGSDIEAKPIGLVDENPELRIKNEGIRQESEYLVF